MSNDNLDKLIEFMLSELAFNHLGLPTNKARTKIDEDAKILINSQIRDKTKKQKLFDFYMRIKNPRYLRFYRDMNKNLYK